MTADLRSTIDNLVRAGRDKPAGYTTDAILAAVVDHATRDPAIKRASVAINAHLWPDELRAAILAALDGEGGA